MKTNFHVHCALEKKRGTWYSVFMKRFFFEAIAFFSAALFAGCASSKIDLVDYQPVAVVCVSGNTTVPWYVNDRDKTSETDGESGGALTGALNRAMGANNPEIQLVNARVDYAADALCTLLERNSIAVVEPSIVQDAPTIKLAGNGLLSHLEESALAEGYKQISSSSPRRNRMICEETGAKSLIFAEFIFQKQKINTGLVDLAAAARVTLKIYLADENGRKALEKSYVAVSAESTPYKNGKWDKEALCSYFEGAIDSVINQFIFDCMGDVSNAESFAEDGEVQGTTISVLRPKQNSPQEDETLTEQNAQVDTESAFE